MSEVYVAEDMELGRRVVHASGGAPIALFLLDVISWTVLGGLLGVCALTVVLLEYARLRRGLSNWVYEHLTRPYEENSVAGYAYYMIGLAAAWVVLPPAGVIVGCVALSLGDPLSGIMSSSEDSWLRRSVSAVVMFVLVAGSVVVVLGDASVLQVAAVAFVSGCVAVVSDMYVFRVRGWFVDDNLLLPLVPPSAMIVAQFVLL